MILREGNTVAHVFAVEILPTYEGIAPDLGALIPPSNTVTGKLIVRRGIVASETYSALDTIMAYAQGFGMCGVIVLSDRNGWTLEKGLESTWKEFHKFTAGQGFDIIPAPPQGLQ